MLSILWLLTIAISLIGILTPKVKDRDTLPYYNYMPTRSLRLDDGSMFCEMYFSVYAIDDGSPFIPTTGQKVSTASSILDIEEEASLFKSIKVCVFRFNFESSEQSQTLMNLQL